MDTTQAQAYMLSAGVFYIPAGTTESYTTALTGKGVTISDMAWKIVEQ